VSTLGDCGDVLTLQAGQAAGDPLALTIALPSNDPTEVWTISAVQQELGAGTGGRIGDPVAVDAMLAPLTFNVTTNQFLTSGSLTDTAGLTHEISYTATRTSPAPLTCTNLAYWTHPNGSAGPTPENPAARPDSAPALTGSNQAAAGTNDALIQFDQEMLASGDGIPAPDDFTVVVGGAARTVSAVAITNDAPPADATLDLTLDGAALAAGQTMTVSYHAPADTTAPALQDPESVKTLLFGPTTVPIS
jgi:hypothetical protein